MNFTYYHQKAAVIPNLYKLWMMMFKVAQSGDRVGIAIRGAKEDSLSNGSIIVKPAVNDKKTNTHIPLSVVEHKISKLALKTSPFQKRVLTEGDVVTC